MPPTAARLPRHLAAELIEAAGFTITHRNRKLRGTGLTVPYIATDSDGRAWYFDVSGAFTTSRDGMLRTDTVWKSLGRAHVLAHNNPDAAPPRLPHVGPPPTRERRRRRAARRGTERVLRRDRVARRTTASSDSARTPPGRDAPARRLLDRRAISTGDARSSRPRARRAVSSRSSATHSSRPTGSRSPARRRSRGSASRSTRSRRAPRGQLVWFEYKGSIQGIAARAAPHRHAEEGGRQRCADHGDRRAPAVHRAHVAPADGRRRPRDARHRRRSCGYFADVVCIYDPSDQARLKHL